MKKERSKHPVRFPEEKNEPAHSTSLVQTKALPANSIVFGETSRMFGWLGNLAAGFPIKYEGHVYPSSEALFQSLRFPESAEARAVIQASKSPANARKLAAKHKRNLKLPLRDENDVGRMRFCLVLKLSQNRQLLPELLRTHPKFLVQECISDQPEIEIDGSPSEVPFWGALVRKKEVIGQNRVGELLMSIRSDLLNAGKTEVMSPKGDMVEVNREGSMGKAAFAPQLLTDESPLSAQEKKSLANLEKRIREAKEKVEDGFVEMVKCMWQIYEQRLYRNEGRTFAQYFKENWKFERAHSYRLIHCGRLLSVMESELLKDFTNQAQFRPLLTLCDDSKIQTALDRISAWKKEIGGLEITSALVQSAVAVEKGQPVELPKISEYKISGAKLDVLLDQAEAQLSTNPNDAQKIISNLRSSVAALGRKSTTGISWTDATWNPLQGCKKISDGCRYCYAATLLATRLKSRYPGVAERIPKPAKVGAPFDFTGKVVLLVDSLAEPIDCKTPKRYFVNSLSDLFYDEVPEWFIDQVFDVMEKAAWHVFQVLTKRPARMAAYTTKRYSDISPPGNIWLGTTIENQKEHDRRIPELAKVKAAVKWLSCEPLLRSVRLDLASVDWVVVGGESGSGRKMEKDWATSIRDQCSSKNVKFFFKQWGDFNESGEPNKHTKKDGTETLDGKIEHAYPDV